MQLNWNAISLWFIRFVLSFSLGHDLCSDWLSVWLQSDRVGKESVFWGKQRRGVMREMSKMEVGPLFCHRCGFGWTVKSSLTLWHHLFRKINDNNHRMSFYYNWIRYTDHQYFWLTLYWSQCCVSNVIIPPPPSFVHGWGGLTYVYISGVICNVHL